MSESVKVIELVGTSIESWECRRLKGRAEPAIYGLPIASSTFRSGGVSSRHPPR
jgi:hypothetical protein